MRRFKNILFIIVIVLLSVAAIWRYVELNTGRYIVNSFNDKIKINSMSVYNDGVYYYTNDGGIYELSDNNESRCLIAAEDISGICALESYVYYISKEKIFRCDIEKKTSELLDEDAGYKYIFRSTGNGNLINTGLVDAMETMGTKKVGIVAVSSEYGENGVKNMTALLEDTDIELAPVEYFTTGDTDFTAQFTNLMNEGVDSILLYSNTTEQAQSMPQLERLGFEGLVFGTEGCSSSDLRNVAGESANGLIFVASYVIPDEVDDAINDVEKDFLETYVEKYGALPVSDTAYRAYDVANLIFEAMKNCENIDDKESIRDAFVQISGYEGIGGTFDYTDESGDGLSSARTYIIVDGKNVLLEDYLAEQG